MISYGQVMEIFHDYLSETSCVEILKTKWGYVRLFCEMPYYDSFEAVLCRTPEELFEELLDYALAARECRLMNEMKKTKEEAAEAVRAARQFYIGEFQRKNEKNETPKVLPGNK